jgi:hypothetical protein
VAKLVFKTKPRAYQVPALKKMVANEGGGLYVPMRWGKSWIAINWAAAMALKNFPHQEVSVLITCPNDVVYEWVEQIEWHCPFPYQIHSKGVKLGQSWESTTGSGGSTLAFEIRNFEGMFARERDSEIDPKTGKLISREWSAVTDIELLASRPKLHIVDEVHHIGNPSTKQSVKTCQVARTAYHRLMLTGTPFHRKPFYLFGQFKFYDPSIFGTNFGAYKRHIAIMGGYHNYEVKGYRNLKYVRDKVRPHVWISKRVPLAPPVKRRILFSLDESKYVYQEMERESVVQLRDSFAVADIVLTRHLRLQQIAGGWVRVQDGKMVRVGEEKKKAFARRVNEYQEQGIERFVVGARFLKELVDIYEVVKAAGFRPLVVHGGVSPERRKDKRRTFAETSNTVFISQFRASREGIDLSAADLMVYYSLPEDFLTYSQFGARIEKFEDKRTLLYEHIIAKGTRDEVSFEALKQQQDVATFLMSNPRYVEKITAKV